MSPRLLMRSIVRMAVPYDSPEAAASDELVISGPER